MFAVSYRGALDWTPTSIFSAQKFKGGKKFTRDRTFGLPDAFWDWWENNKTDGRDIMDSRQARKEYEEWLDLGSPKAPKADKRGR